MRARIALVQPVTEAAATPTAAAAIPVAAIAVGTAAVRAATAAVGRVVHLAAAVFIRRHRAGRHPAGGHGAPATHLRGRRSRRTGLSSEVGAASGDRSSEDEQLYS